MPLQWHVWNLVDWLHRKQLLLSTRSFPPGLIILIRKQKKKKIISRKIIENSPVWGSPQHFNVKPRIRKGILPTWPNMHPLNTYVGMGEAELELTPYSLTLGIASAVCQIKEFFPPYIYLPFCAVVLSQTQPWEWRPSWPCLYAARSCLLWKVLIRSPLKWSERLSLTSVSAWSGPKRTLYNAMCSYQNGHASFCSWHKAGSSPRHFPKEGYCCWIINFWRPAEINSMCLIWWPLFSRQCALRSVSPLLYTTVTMTIRKWFSHCLLQALDKSLPLWPEFCLQSLFWRKKPLMQLTFCSRQSNSKASSESNNITQWGMKINTYHKCLLTVDCLLSACFISTLSKLHEK